MCHSLSCACCIAEIRVPLCLTKPTLKKKKKTERKQQKEPFHQKETLSSVLTLDELRVLAV